MPDRELMEANPGDKRHIRRNKNERFTKDQVDVGRSLAADRRQKAKNLSLPEAISVDRRHARLTAMAMARHGREAPRLHLAGDVPPLPPPSPR